MPPTQAISSTSLPIVILPTAPISASIDTATIAADCLAFLADLQPHHLDTNAFWRDFLCLTGGLRTLHTSAIISQIWRKQSALYKPGQFKLVEKSSHVFELPDAKGRWITARFTFTTSCAGSAPSACSRCWGIMMIVPCTLGNEREGNSSGWKIWVLSTVLEEFVGGGIELGNPDVMAPPLASSPHLPSIDATSGAEKGTASCGQQVLDAVIVGAGMAGLCTAVHLQALGLSYTVFDRNTKVGDNWASRYDSCKMHISKEYMEMPFGRCHSEFGYYLTKCELAQGLNDFAEGHGLRVEMKTAVESAVWDGEQKIWMVKVRREGEREGRTKVVEARHLVLALGGGLSRPYMPEYEGREAFAGDVLHSACWQNGKKWRGKKGIVIGSANTAFDVAEDMVGAGLESVYMVERSATHVIPASHFQSFLDGLYTPQADIRLADRSTMALPYAVGRLIIMAGSEKLLNQEPGLYDPLKAAGFKVTISPDIMACVSERLGGHYLDVGGTKMIEDGRVQVKSDSLPVRYTTRGLEFEDGSTIDADVVVFCTGFSGNMREDASRIVGPVVADQLEDFWGLNKEGQYRGLAVPLGHPGIWFMGGGNAFSRFFSRFLALQIKADVERYPFESMQDE